MEYRGMTIRVRLARYPGRAGWLHDVEISGNSQRLCHRCDGHVYPTQKAAEEAGVRYGKQVIEGLLE